MIVKENGVSIVLVGKWNSFILTPEWVKNNLFSSSTEIKVEFAINFDAPVRLKIGSLIFIPRQDKVVIISQSLKNEDLKLLEDVAIKLCETLQHTPFISFGVNFGYVEKDNKTELFKYFQFLDSEKINENSWIIKPSQIKRGLMKENLFINFVLELDSNDDINFDFNFHFACDSIVKVKDMLKDKAISYKDCSLEILKNFYNLTLE